MPYQTAEEIRERIAEIKKEVDKEADGYCRTGVLLGLDTESESLSSCLPLIEKLEKEKKEISNIAKKMYIALLALTPDETYGKDMLNEWRIALGIKED